MSANDSNTVVQTTAADTSPTLSGANNFTTIQGDPVTNNGNLVSDLISGQVSDPDAGQSIGIAVVSVNNGAGDWRYSADGGLNWSDFSSPSNSNALLLNADSLTRIRFVPDAGFSGAIANGIKFRAWDGFTGTAGTTADTRTVAYSTTVGTSAITVTPVLTITGTGTTTINDNQTTNPFAGVTIGDPDAPNETLTVTVTQSDLTNGTLSNLGGFTEVGTTGVYHFSGKASNATAALRGIVFTPTLHQVALGNSVSTTFALAVSDSAGATANDSGAVVQATATNTAPTLSGANNFAAIPGDPSTNNGTLVSDLISGQVSDPDAGQSIGIAINATVTSHGSWQYTTDGGVTWNNVGNPTNSASLLLAADSLTRIRFVPNAGFSGTVTGGIRFRAWDMSDGNTPGTTVDTTTNGGSTAYSSANAASSITVTPVLTITGTGTTSINDNQTTHPFAAVTIGDPDAPNETLTVTVTQSDTTNGALSNLSGFTETSPGVYTFSGRAGPATAALRSLVFTPTAHQASPGGSVTTTFTLLVTDVNGSSATDSGTVVQVAAVNTAPTLNGANNLPAVMENDTTNNGILVSDMIAGQTSDPDAGQSIGIAVTGVDNSNGTWQYSTDGGTSWNSIGNPDQFNGPAAGRRQLDAGAVYPERDLFRTGIAGNHVPGVGRIQHHGSDDNRRHDDQRRLDGVQLRHGQRQCSCQRRAGSQRREQPDADRRESHVESRHTRFRSDCRTGQRHQRQHAGDRGHQRR